MPAPQFLAIPADSRQPPRCVDGRPDSDSQLGPQMLGGSLLPIFITAAFTNSPFTADFVTARARRLTSAGFTLGVHRGSHTHADNSDCGFADQLKLIVQKSGLYPPDNILITGNALVTLLTSLGAAAENLAGDHEESICYVNSVPLTTFDTLAANRAGWQAFNLDLWAVLEQTACLGVNPDYAAKAALALYQATEYVLVESRGQPALPVTRV